MEQLRSRLNTRQNWYAIPTFRSRLNSQMENMSMEQLRSRLNTRQNWYAIATFRSGLYRQMENMSTERLRSRLNTKQNWYAIVPFPCEQPICLFQKLERRWNGTISFPCEQGLKDINAMKLVRLKLQQTTRFVDLLDLVSNSK